MTQNPPLFNSELIVNLITLFDRTANFRLTPRHWAETMKSTVEFWYITELEITVGHYTKFWECLANFTLWLDKMTNHLISKSWVTIFFMMLPVNKLSYQKKDLKGNYFRYHIVKSKNYFCNMLKPYLFSLPFLSWKLC